MSQSTLISEKELEKMCLKEGIDFSQVCVVAPRWAESAPLKTGVRSALVRCDLIIRDDGSAVYLDGCMAIDSIEFATHHIKGETNKEGLPWELFVEKMTEMPEPINKE